MTQTYRASNSWANMLLRSYDNAGCVLPDCISNPNLPLVFQNLWCVCLEEVKIAEKHEVHISPALDDKYPFASLQPELGGLYKEMVR